MLAAASGHFALVEFFMHSANAKAVDKDNNSVLLWLCRNVGEDDTNTRKHVLALIRKGSDVNVRNTVRCRCCRCVRNLCAAAALCSC